MGKQEAIRKANATNMMKDEHGRAIVSERGDYREWQKQKAAEFLAFPREQKQREADEAKLAHRQQLAEEASIVQPRLVEPGMQDAFVMDFFGGVDLAWAWFCETRTHLKFYSTVGQTA